MKDNLQRAKHAFIYLLYIHIAALLVFFVFRWVLFVSMDYTFPEHIQSDWGLQAIAFIKGVWFDNVIACYIMVLPLRKGDVRLVREDVMKRSFLDDSTLIISISAFQAARGQSRRCVTILRGSICRYSYLTMTTMLSL